ncbi:MAG: DMT family transporter [candidate division WOR-3 bacterium]|nr:DMT family transporter [candidate division WOR-3 bacterium]
MQDQQKAYTYAVFVVLMWSTIASAFKFSLRYLDYAQLLFYATAVSTFTLFTILLIQNKIGLLRGCTFRDCVYSLLLGFLNPFLYYVVLLRAYSLLPAQQAMALNYTWAIQLVLLSIPLLRQSIGLKSVLAVIISYLGVVIIATRGDFAGLRFFNPTGVLLALGSAVIWALFWIFNIKDRRDEVAKLFLNFVFGFVFIVIYMMLTGRFTIPNLPGFLGAAYVGIFEMGITFVLWLKALRLSRTTAQVSNLIYLTPFFALVFINLFVGERILASTVIGLAFIVSGILLQKYPFQKK